MLKHAFSAAALAALTAGGAWAADNGGGHIAGHAVPHEAKDRYTVGTLTVERPWARASLGKAANGAAYFSVRNTGSAADRLIGVASPVAAKAALHKHINDNGIMRMRPVKDMTVPAGETAMLQPGGYHVMLMGLHAPLKDGATFPLTLEFAKAGKVKVQVHVRKMSMHGGAQMHH